MCMTRRTTIELDEGLLARARLALGTTTMRSTVEAALRRCIDEQQAVEDRRRAARADYVARLAERADLDVLASDQMWS